MSKVVDTSDLNVVLRYFNNKPQVAEALGLNRRVAYYWGNRVPRQHRVRLEQLITQQRYPKPQRAKIEAKPSATPLLDNLLGREP